MICAIRTECVISNTYSDKSLCIPCTHLHLHLHTSYHILHIQNPSWMQYSPSGEGWWACGGVILFYTNPVDTSGRWCSKGGSSHSRCCRRLPVVQDYHDCCAADTCMVRLLNAWRSALFFLLPSLSGQLPWIDALDHPDHLLSSVIPGAVAKSVEHWSRMWEIVGSNPSWVKPMTDKIDTCCFLARCLALLG